MKGSPLRYWVADRVATAMLSQRWVYDEFTWVSQEMLVDALERIRLRLPEGTQLIRRPVEEYYVSEEPAGQR